MDDKQEEKAPPGRETGERGKHNRIGYYNSDEEATHDEAGTQGEGADERRPENA
jgi:hypothetical protein